MISGLCLLASMAGGATWYVDSAATGANNGTSWANAWTSLGSMSSIAPGDTIFISGGPAGSTRAYTSSAVIPWVNGSSGSAPTLYLIGQDSQHNGTALINLSGNNFLPSTAKNLTILGDAGDGQMHFSLTNCSAIGVISSSSAGQYIRVGYVNFGSSPWGFRDDYPTGLEFDHNYLFKLQDPVCDFFLTAGSPPTSGYGMIKIHHNTVYLPRGGQAAGFGDDGITGASGFDIYNNTLIAYPTNYTGSQHQDGMQETWAIYTRVYNNTFINLANSDVFPEPLYGNVQHFLVYNNIFTCNNASLTGSPMRGVDVNSGLASRTGYNYFDVVIANNLIVDLSSPGHLAAFAVRMDDTLFTFTGCVVANNISINSSGFSINSVVTNLSNAGDFAWTSGAGHFVSYTPFGTANDFHLLATDTTFRGNGANLSAYFNVDRDGSPRPATGAWDIGPFQYGASAPAATNPVITVTPNTLDFGTVMVDDSVTNTFTVQNTGTGTLAGSATVNPPFQILSGGTYNLGSNQSQTVSIVYNPVTVGTNTATITLTGGGGTNLNVTGSTWSALSFPAYAGDITAPFVTNNGYLSQPIQTGVTNGGRAAYTFVIPTAGTYLVTANVNAPGDAANSFYVNIDGEPVDPTMIWDIPITSGFTNQTVTWRGNGTDVAPQFVPQIFNLSAGPHQLIIRGREAGVQLGAIAIVPSVKSNISPPMNLRIGP